MDTKLDVIVRESLTQFVKGIIEDTHRTFFGISCSHRDTIQHIVNASTSSA